MADYHLEVLDATGTNKLAIIKDDISEDYARTENAVGAATFTVPPAYRPIFFTGSDVKFDTRILPYRSLPGGTPYLDMETEWLVQDGEEVQDSTGKRALNLYCVDGNFILSSRNVAYYANTAYTTKSTYAGNLMKAVVRENIGALAVDTTRDLTAYMTVQANLGDGASVPLSFDRQQVLDVCIAAANASAKAGTYIAFDVVSSSPGFLEFRTYANYRGNDHRSTSASPVKVGRDAGNVTDFKLRFVHTGEVNSVYAGGSGDASTRPIGSSSDASRIAASPFRRIEKYISGLNTVLTTELNAQADAEVRADRPKATIDGTIIQKDGFLYGLHFKWGDYLTLSDNGMSFDIRLSNLRVQVKDGKETITSKFKADSI